MSMTIAEAATLRFFLEEENLKIMDTEDIGIPDTLRSMLTTRKSKNYQQLNMMKEAWVDNTNLSKFLTVAARHSEFKPPECVYSKSDGVYNYKTYDLVSIYIALKSKLDLCQEDLQQTDCMLREDAALDPKHDDRKFIRHIIVDEIQELNNLVHTLGCLPSGF